VGIRLVLGFAVCSYWDSFFGNNPELQLSKYSKTKAKTDLKTLLQGSKLDVKKFGRLKIDAATITKGNQEGNVVAIRSYYSAEVDPKKRRDQTCGTSRRD
jgi:hypothetical protein